MSDHLDYDALRADTVCQVAKLMAAAAVTPLSQAASSSLPASTFSSRP